MVQKHCKNYDCCPSLHPTCSQKCSDSRKVSGFGFLWSVRSPLPMWCVRPQVNSLQLAPGLPWSTLKRGPFHCSFSLLLLSLQGYILKKLSFCQLVFVFRVQALIRFNLFQENNSTNDLHRKFLCCSLGYHSCSIDLLWKGSYI